MHGIQALDDSVQRQTKGMCGGSGGQRVADVMGTEQIELDPRHTQWTVQVERRATTLILGEISGMEICASVVQREGQHLAITGALFPDAEGLVIKVQYCHAILTQTFEDLALGFDNLLRAAELADMRSAGIVDQRHLWLGQSNGVGNLANARGTQLDDCRGMLRGDFKQGQRGAEVVVQVATRGQDRTAGAQDAGEHFLDRGLAAGAGDGSDRLVERGTVQRTQLAQSLAAIGNQQLRQAGAWHFSFDQGSNSALGLYFIEVIVTVKTRPGQGDKQLPGNDCATVDADAAEAGISTQQAGLQRRGQLAEGQWFKHEGPPRLQALSRLQPGRKSRDADR
ncbi:hypothetical protein D3C77_230540 [compost metagenome]